MVRGPRTEKDGVSMEYIGKWKDDPVHKQKTRTGFKHTTRGAERSGSGKGAGTRRQASVSGLAALTQSTWNKRIEKRESRSVGPHKSK